MSREVIILKRETWRDEVLVMVETWSPIPDADPAQWDYWVSRPGDVTLHILQDTVDSPQ